MSMCRTYLIACLLLASVSATAGAREWSAGLYSAPTGIGLQAQLPSGDGRETDIISVIADTYGLISGRTADIGVRVGYTHDYIISTYEADGFTMNFHAGAGLTVGYVHDGENGSILGTGEALQKEMGLKEDENVLTFAIVSRLTDQKGLDLVDQVMDRLCSMNINLIVLGTGNEYYENMFRYYQGKYPDKVAACIGYSEDLAHRIYAGADALLVPSAFEPCGLTQLISLRYGAIPVVHETGGLKDTVKPFNEFEDKGTGFSFSNYSSSDLIDRLKHAEWIYYNRKALWKNMQKRGMSEDWSWNNSMQIYKDLYSRM